MTEMWHKHHKHESEPISSADEDEEIRAMGLEAGKELEKNLGIAKKLVEKEEQKLGREMTEEERAQFLQKTKDVVKRKFLKDILGISDEEN